MAMRIDGLGGGPFADRKSLGERRPRRRSPAQSPQQQKGGPVQRARARSEQMRVEFAALNRAIRDSEDALAILQCADAGLERVAGLLEHLEQRLCPIAAGASAGDGPDGAEPARRSWLAETLAAIEEVAEQTRFGDLRLLDGSLGCSGAAVGDGLSFVAASEAARSSPPHGYEVMLTREPVRATLLGDAPLTAEVIAGGVRLSLEEGGRQAGEIARAGQSSGAVAQALQQAAEAGGLALTVDATSDARLLVQHQCFGSSHRFTAASSVPGVLSGADGSARRVANGRDIAGFINGEPATGDGQTLTGCPENATTAGVVVRYTGLPYTGCTGRLPRRRPAILKVRVFAGRVIVAQQALTLRLDEHGGGTVRIGLKSVRPAALGRDVETASGYISLADIRAGTAGESADALKLVAWAQVELSEHRQRLKALCAGRLADVLARLRVKAQNLVAASADIEAAPAAWEAVRELSVQIRREARWALTAQSEPTRRSSLWLIDSEPAREPGPRWN